MRIEQKLAIPLVIISIGNIVKSYMYNDPLLYYFLYSGVFILIAFIIQFVKLKINEKYWSLIMILFSLASAFPSDLNSLNVAFFFLSSLLLYKFNKRIYWIYGFLISSLLIVRFESIDLKSSSTINYLAAVVFISIIYQYYIYPKINSNSKKSITLEYYYSPEVNNDVVDIIQNRCMGLDWPEINVKLELCINDSELPRKVRKERKRLGFKNQDQFNLWLFQNGIIKPKTDKLNMQA